MRKKWVSAAGLLLVLLVALAGAACAPKAAETRTLESLKRVDDHPLYVMHYYGDYEFDAEVLEALPAVSSGAVPAWACTCFAALNPTGDPIFGRNFDWYDHAALLLFTDPPNRYASVSMVDISYLGYAGDTPPMSERQNLLRAPYTPFDGMNEQGLAVGMMAVPHGEGGTDPQEPTVDSLLLIRLLLDYAADVDEALALVQKYNVDWGGGPPVHYLLADASGHSAVVEYLGGEPVVLRGTEPWQVSTNFIISEAMPEGANSACWRYNRAYEALQQAEGHMSSEEAMALLAAVAQDITIWSAVYDLTSGEIRVAMDGRYAQVHEFRLEIAGQ